MNPTADETDKMLDRLDGLYQRDPEAFEVLRRELIEHVIDGFDHDRQQRARAMQFSLEVRLARYRHPVARLNKMIEIFWEQFSDFRLALNDPAAFADEARRRKRPSGKVIPLRQGARLH
jgi:hypothetical protein